MSEPGDKKVTMRRALADLDEAVNDMLAYFSTIDPSDVPTLLKAFALLRDNKDILTRLEKAVSAQYEKLSYQVIPETFETLGYESIKIDGRNFIISTRVNASIPEDKRAAGLEWLTNEAKIPELIKPTVNSKQLSSFVTAYFNEHGKWPPEEVMTVHKQNYTQIRKA